MNHEHIARVLAELGKREAKATRELLSVQAERCRFLTDLAHQSSAASGNQAVTLVAGEPKDK